MTITLSDITAATAAYIDNEIDVAVRRVTANLDPGEDGTFTLTITNASEPTGVRVSSVVLHLTVSDPSVALLRPPGSALLTPRAENDADAPRLGRDDLVDNMFIFFVDGDIEPNNTLDVGEVVELELEYQAVGAGDATINAHVHATIEADDVFPRSNGTNGSKSVTVRS